MCHTNHAIWLNLIGSNWDNWRILESFNYAALRAFVVKIEATSTKQSTIYIYICNNKTNKTMKF